MNAIMSTQTNSQPDARISAFLDSFHRACARSKRRPEEICVVAVSKGHPASAVRQAVRSGFSNIGENRVQEATAKAAALEELPVRWHLIGSLQTNKVRPAVRLFSVVQSVDRPDLAAALEKECARQNKKLDVLVQIDATREPTKHGAALDDARRIADSVLASSHLAFRGLMTIGPNTTDVSAVRECFRSVRAAFEDLRVSAGAAARVDTLSMGMSGDYEIAIEEGSTMIRVGTAIFGPRTAP